MWCCSLLNREPGQEHRILSERPAGNDRGDGKAGAEAGDLVAALQCEHERGEPGEHRYDQRGQAIPLNEPVVDPMGVRVQHREPPERHGPGDDACAECARSELSLEVPFTQARRVRGEVDSGQIAGTDDRERADQDRGGASPA